jgi:PKD repeat protein
MQNAVTVNALPTASFTQQINGLEITATNTSSNYNNILWTLPDNSQSSQQTVTFAASQNGNYTFSLLALNQCGSNNTTQVVNLNSLPVAEFTSNASALGVCSPIAVQYNLVPNTGASYLWTFEGGNPATSNIENPIVTYADSGSFDVVLIVSNSLGSDTTTFVNYINLTDVADVDYTHAAVGGTVNFTYTGEGPATLLWDFAGLGFSNEINPQFTFTSSGTYPVTLISENPCGNDTLTKEVIVVISSIDNIKLDNLKVYPNPVEDKLIIENESDIDRNCKIEVTDILGRIYQYTTWHIGTKTKEIKMDNLPSGIYIIAISNGENTSKFKVLKN